VRTVTEAPWGDPIRLASVRQLVVTGPQRSRSAPVVSILPAGDSSELRLRAPDRSPACLAFKGSLAVDGVSLTINRVEDSEHACDVTINLIPHTLAATTLGRLLPGQRVNLEVDPWRAMPSA